MSWLRIHLKLLPFYAFEILYWSLRIQSAETESMDSVVVKCLPIASLALYALNSDPLPNKGKLYYSVICGLVLCCIADGLLVYEHLFLGGMIAFALGHVSYQIGFGWEELRPMMGIVLCTLLTAVLYFIVPHITDTLVMYMAPVYGLLLIFNVWRSFAWAKRPVEYLCGIGFIMFAISDTLLIFNRYHTDLKMAGRIGVMVTYYLAQYFISLGVFASMELPHKLYED